jgi:hypothetical protein
MLLLLASHFLFSKVLRPQQKAACLFVNTGALKMEKSLILLLAVERLTFGFFQALAH